MEFAKKVRFGKEPGFSGLEWLRGFMQRWGVTLTSIAWMMLGTALVWGQAPEFEAVSVKAAGAMERGNCRGGPGSNSPGQYMCVGGSLELYVLRAWEVERYELAAPAEISETRFNITAKVPANATPHDFNLMLRSLLEQRVGVRV